MKKFIAVLCLSLIALCSVGCSKEEITTTENERVSNSLVSNINLAPEKWKHVQAGIYENADCKTVVSIPIDITSRSIICVEVDGQSCVLFDSDAIRVKEAINDNYLTISKPIHAPGISPTNYNRILSALQTCS